MEQRCCGSEIVRESPGLRSESCHEYAEGHQWKAHTPIAKDPREGQQREAQSGTKIKLPKAGQFIATAAERSAERAVFLELRELPPVEIAHDFVVIGRFRARLLPKKIGCCRI